METITELEFSPSLWSIVEEGSIFEPINKINQFENGKWMIFETFSDDMDGVFPRVNEWTKFANRIDKEGISEYLNFISRRNKLKIKQGYCTIIRESKWDEKATLIFEKPIKVIVGEFNNEPIIKECTQIEGRFSYEWYWMSKGRQDRIANGIEIYFNCEKFLK